MPRVYSNYTDAEMARLRQESSQAGLSPSAYQKYRTLLGLTDVNSLSLAGLAAKMRQALSLKRKGDRFIVSALLPDEWTVLTRSQKNTLSKQLKKIVAEHPERYAVHDVLPGKINQYIVLSEGTCQKSEPADCKKPHGACPPPEQSTEGD